MKRFSDAYAQAARTIRDFTFSGTWNDFVNDTAGLKSVFSSDDGPTRTHGDRIEKLRDELKCKASEGVAILKMAGINPQGTQVLTTDQANAIATLKLARHFYLQHKQGAQCVWVWANPQSLHGWIFDEVKFKTPSAACAALDKLDELYPEAARRHLGAALNNARLWVGNCVTKLTNPDAKTRGMVETWFFDKHGTDKEVADVAAKLCTGFKRIQNIIASNRLIFSDDPPRRFRGAEAGKHSSDKWKGTRASVAADRGEKLDVVYVKGGLLADLGKDRKEWAVIRTIVHELSHRMMDGTKDVSYRHDGIKPGGALTLEHALRNADSWAFFAADVNGEVTDAVRTRFYKSPAALRSKYLKWLEKNKTK